MSFNIASQSFQFHAGSIKGPDLRTNGLSLTTGRPALIGILQYSTIPPEIRPKESSGSLETTGYRGPTTLFRPVSPRSSALVVTIT